MAPSTTLTMRDISTLSEAGKKAYLLLAEAASTARLARKPAKAAEYDTAATALLSAMSPVWVEKGYREAAQVAA